MEVEMKYLNDFSFFLSYIRHVCHPIPSDSSSTKM